MSNRVLALVRLLLDLAGIGGIVAGVWSLSEPAGLVAAGVGALLISFAIQQALKERA